MKEMSEVIVGRINVLLKERKECCEKIAKIDRELCDISNVYHVSVVLEG